MRYNAGAKNAMLDQLGTLVTHIGLHTAHPSDAGSNEVTGGSPAYARQPVAWAAASGGSKAITGTEVFDVPAGDVAFVGLWSALSAGTFYGSVPAGSVTPVPFTAVGSTDLFTADAHGLVDTNTVVVFDTLGAALPTGIAEGTRYFVRDVSGDTFKLAATLGGAAIDITTDGAGFVQKITIETFGAQGTYTVSALTLDLNL